MSTWRRDNITRYIYGWAKGVLPSLSATEREAIEAGVDSIEHGSELDQEAVDYMKNHHVVYVPTVRVVVTGLANSTPKPGTAQTFMQYKAQLQAKTHFAAFALALKNGVTIEERAKVAPAARRSFSPSIDLRKAKPEPRSTIPSTASTSGT